MTASLLIGGIPVVRSAMVPRGRMYVLGRSPHVSLVVYDGDCDRYDDPHTEQVRRQAIADAVETVRAGLAHLVPRDRTTEMIRDLQRPSVPACTTTAR